MPPNPGDVEAIVAAVPGFRANWDKFLKGSEREDRTPYYMGMSDLAHYVVDSYAKGATSEFPNLFATVERLLHKHDKDLESLITVGLFEDIKNIASHRDFGFRVFRQWLGPRSLEIWEEVDAFTQRVASWQRRQQRQRPRWWQVWRRRKGFDSEKALAQVESPELRRIIESTYRKKQ